MKNKLITQKIHNMKIQKLYPKHWLNYHPYKQTDDVDQYYTGIANQINRILHTIGVNEDEDGYANMSLILSAWFEDIISQTHIWETFTEECQKRYGARLPFYPIGTDYISDEINMEDVRFILWHILQRQYEGDRIINPENPGIRMAAEQIYALLSKEYETAPENKRMQTYFHAPELGPKDFLTYRKRLEWFHYQCYFTAGNQEQLYDAIEEVQASNAIDNIEQLDILCYAQQVALPFRSRKNLLSLTSSEWLARIWKRNGSKAGPWETVESLADNHYLYIEEDNSCIYLQSLCGEIKTFAVDKESLNLNQTRDLKPEQSIVSCMLVRYGETWWQNGAMLVNDKTPQWDDILQEQDHKMNPIHNRKAFEHFVQASGGKPFVYCRNKKELETFFREKMGYQIRTGMTFPEIGKSGALLMATPQTGLHIQLELIECICSPDNPAYNREEAEAQAFLFFVNPDVIPYELSCLLQDKGLLPDACINSLHGQQHGKALLHNNACFLTDYYFHRYREKDFKNSLLEKFL